MDQDEDIRADWSANELSILRSAELDSPPQGSVERTLTALGVSAALGAGAGTGAALAGAHVGRVAHGSAWPKWLSAVVVGGGLASALFFGRHHETSVPTGSSHDSPNSSAPVKATSEPLIAAADVPSAGTPAVSLAPALGVEPALTVAPAPSSVTRAPVRAGVAESKDTLAAEIRMIDEARDRLRHGDAKGSLETLARYDQLVKRGGSMRAEATVVRIEALQASGDPARALALGQRFLAKNPDSPYADYIRRVLPDSR